MPAPKRVVIADDKTPADLAYRLACEGTALLWRGDFQNARQLLQALARRADHKGDKGKRAKAPKPPASAAEAFHLHRQAQSQRARTLAMLLVPFEADYTIPLRRAPDVKLVCNEAYGRGEEPFVSSLRELLGLIGAHEWRKNGVEIAALGERIHPHYGVFSPIRGEYVQLVAEAPLPPRARLAFDIGTGTGVLAALLARRGLARVLATDTDPRALSCARENLLRLDLGAQVELIAADLFPAGRADLIVCNPPWLPGRPSASIESAIYDPDSRMLKGFLAGLAAHLEPGGEGWLILSDLAEHLGLRPREQLLALFEAGGLALVARHDVRPTHPRASDADDPLHAARAAEVTSLWRLVAKA
ncbi:methyltransferase [Massilia glaciei]|uniref:Methyltransferase domain-containing protein n=1 Tax=Massilia glaciei TaxID=1524097 RepID=A0A2U2HP22_9BURK|nr:class I SAM-dependent methyltransferase [Massilia glaciei]PWF49274.1 methyltransferase domain-containing protein [Massilia glaciei]